MTLRLAMRGVVFLVASGACGATGETIMQIQGTTHRSPLAGRAVSGVHGIVTARSGSGFYVQDRTGDGDPATKWCVEHRGQPVIWELRLPEAKAVPAYAITAGDDTPK